MSEIPRNAIAVLAATGFTGQLIAERLVEKKLPLILAGRDATKLAHLQTRLNSHSVIKTMVASPNDPVSLAALFAPPTALVINCAGPFTDLGEPVVKAAIEAGIHYLDITGEQVYMARILDRYHALATERDCLVVPACGFEYAVGNWAATVAAEGLEPLEQITIAVATKNASTSRATQLSALKLLSEAGYSWQDGQRKARLTASKSKLFDFPAPFGKQRTLWVPFGDLVTLPRHLKVKNIDGYMYLPGAMGKVLPFVFPFLPFFSTILGGLWAKMTAKSFRPPQAAQREAFEWLLQAEATSVKGKKVLRLTGRDVYGLTAVITVYAAEQILAGNYAKAGVLGVAHAFDAQAALEMLQLAGVTVDEV